MTAKKEDVQIEVVIDKEVSFVEEWREGYVTYGGHRYHFWLIEPKHRDANNDSYEIEVRWYFKTVPRQVRAMYTHIIELFKKQTND